MPEIILELHNIVKRFPGVTALDKVHFQLRKGEIHALMGENGAGKSTFIKVITGVYTPDEGQIILKGEEVCIRSPLDAAEKSIAAIYQHSTVYPHLTVAENIFIGRYERKGKFLDWPKMYRKSTELLHQLGSNIDARSEMGSLSVAEMQIVEIVKAISANAEILIMDEPTAALSKRECEHLYEITERLRDNGTSIIFISHRMEDMYKLASRVTVLRDAKYIGTYEVEGLSENKLVQAMVGREIKNLYPKKEVAIGDVVLSVSDLCQRGVFENISFEVRAGEILGFAGLVGSGRTEVFEAVCGINKTDSGVIKLNGHNVSFQHPRDAIDAGVGYLPEDRHRNGLIVDWPMYKNTTLSNLKEYSTITKIDEEAEKRSGISHKDALGIKISKVSDLVETLSGGNQQKVVVSKLLDSEMKVLILDEPTKGVDVGSKVQIYEVIMRLAEKGYAIVLISSEMPEIISMSDRIAIMSNGQILEVVNARETSQEQILEVAMNLNGNKR